MGPSCTYKIKGSCRSNPYDGGEDYKGRGYIQITGRSNYQTYCGLDCVGTSAPELDVCGCKNQWQCTDTDTASCPQVKALQPDYAARIFASYYVQNNLVSQSNAKSYWNVGKKINGGEAYASDFNNKANNYLTLFQNNPDTTSRFLTWLNSGTSEIGIPNAVVGGNSKESTNNPSLPITISPNLDSDLVQTKEFNFKPWGQYLAIEYLSSLYLAAYDPIVTANMINANASSALLYDESKNRNLVKNGQVSKVLTDDDVETTIMPNSPLKLKEGYELTIKYFNVYKKKVFLELRKNGQLVDRKILSPGFTYANVRDKTYCFAGDVGDTKDIVIIAVHFNNLFHNAEGDGVIIDHLFQISDKPTSINVQKIEMSISSFSSIGLSRVVGSNQVWVKKFKFIPWGIYEFIGSSTERRLAAYNSTITSGILDCGESVPFLFEKSDQRDLIATGYTSEILMDDNNDTIITSKSPLMLKEGYELGLKSTDEISVSLELRKNGQPVDSRIIYPGIDNANMEDETYYYKRDLGGTKGIVILAVHFSQQFDGVNEDIAIVNGIFQISDTPTPIR